MKPIQVLQEIRKMRFEEAYEGGNAGRLTHRQAPVDEVMALAEEYRHRDMDWNVKHFHSWYKRMGGTRRHIIWQI
ncbi:MAG: hypothetical protein PHT15_04050 [Gallionellaceae bacterium]|nr:hypothetical protein [Gallionellaceae bacterium]